MIEEKLSAIDEEHGSIQWQEMWIHNVKGKVKKWNI